jgi:hypothetical protein
MSQSWKSSGIAWKNHLSLPVFPSRAIVLSAYSRRPGELSAKRADWYMLPVPK